MRKIRQVEIDENERKRREKKRKCPTLNFFFQALFVYTHCIFHGVRWNCAAAVAVIVVALLCYIYTHTHTLITPNRAHTKIKYTHGISRCLNNKWKFATLNIYTHSHTSIHTHTVRHRHILMRLLMMEKLTSQKEKHFSNFISRNGAQIHNAFDLYIEWKSAFREKKNTYAEMSPLMMLLLSPKEIVPNWQIHTNSSQMSGQTKSHEFRNAIHKFGNTL